MLLAQMVALAVADLYSVAQTELALQTKDLMALLLVQTAAAAAAAALEPLGNLE